MSKSLSTKASMSWVGSHCGPAADSSLLGSSRPSVLANSLVKVDDAARDDGEEDDLLGVAMNGAPGNVADNHETDADEDDDDEEGGDDSVESECGGEGC